VNDHQDVGDHLHREAWGEFKHFHISPCQLKQQEEDDVPTCRLHLVPY